MCRLNPPMKSRPQNLNQESQPKAVAPPASCPAGNEKSRGAGPLSICLGETPANDKLVALKQDPLWPALSLIQALFQESFTTHSPWDDDLGLSGLSAPAKMETIMIVEAGWVRSDWRVTHFPDVNCSSDNPVPFPIFLMASGGCCKNK